MIPELFHIGSLSISPFGVLMVLAFLAAWAQLRWGFRRLEVGDEEDASAMLLAAGIGGIVGAKIYYAVLYQDWRLLLDRAGLVWYGGLVLGGLAVLWVIRRRELRGWDTVDATVPGVVLGYAIGRVGCFLVGDDYGLPTDLPWGAKFPYGLPGPTTAGFMRRQFGADLPTDIPAGELIAVHPTQLYETLACLLIWGLGLWLLRRGPHAGTVALVSLSLLAAERFGIEFLRAKDDRFFGPLTLAQLFSIGLLLVLAAVWLRRRATAE